MVGTTNVRGPRYFTKEWFKYSANARTDTWTTIPGHYYLVGVQTLVVDGSTTSPHTSGVEIITQPTSRARTAGSSGLTADGWLFVVRATGTTARINCRTTSENIDAHPDYNCVHWVDLGGGLPSTIGSTIQQAEQNYQCTSLTRGHYYAVFVCALHDTSEYFTVFLRTMMCQNIFNTSCVQTYNENSLLVHGVLGIVRASFTSCRYMLRNAHSNAAAHQALNWLDLGENFIR